MALDVIQPDLQNRYIDPFQQRVFQFDTPDSRYFLARVNNSLLTALGDDIVTTGFETKSISISGVNNTVIDVEIGLPGIAIQDQTVIYIPEQTSPLIISYDTLNYPDSGRVIITLNYKFVETMSDNPVTIRSHYVASDGRIYSNNIFDWNRDRIILDIIQFEKDASNNITNAYSQANDTIDLYDGTTLVTFYRKGWGDNTKFNMVGLFNYWISSHNPNFQDCRKIWDRDITPDMPHDFQIYYWNDSTSRWELIDLLGDTTVKTHMLQANALTMLSI